MQSAPRALRRLSGYDVNEISLVRVPDINRKMAVCKSAEHDDAPELTDDDLNAKTQVLKSGRVPPMDPMGNIIPDPNALDPAAQEALQNVARILAPVKDNLTSQDILQMATQIGIPNQPESSLGIQDEDYPDDPDGDDDGYGDDAAMPDGDDGDESDAEVTQDDADADSDYSEADDPPDDDTGADNSDDDTPDTPPAAFAKKPAAAPAGPPKPPAASKVKAAKPDNVHPKDHAEATAAANGAYLSALQKKGYKLSSGTKPKENNPMADKTNVNKSAIDWSKYTPADRERFEPIWKSVEETREENARLNTENKQLVQKSASLEDRLSAMEKEGELKQLVQKTAEFKHLDDHQGLASMAMAIPAGEMRDKFIANLQAQNARIEKVVKSGGSDLTKEQGSSAPGREQHGSSVWDTLVKEHVTKSAGKLQPAEAENALLDTPEGRAAFLEYRNSNNFI